MAETFYLVKSALLLELSSKAMNEGWMAEHCLSLALKTHKAKLNTSVVLSHQLAETNLAMLIPPEDTKQGLQSLRVGDDIAWLAKAKTADYAINPENGFFGVAPEQTINQTPRF